jgi:hypothetical protein
MVTQNFVISELSLHRYHTFSCTRKDVLNPQRKERRSAVSELLLRSYCLIVLTVVAPKPVGAAFLCLTFSRGADNSPFFGFVVHNETSIARHIPLPIV